jgi:hypothetical protein
MPPDDCISLLLFQILSELSLAEIRSGATDASNSVFTLAANLTSFAQHQDGQE